MVELVGCKRTCGLLIRSSGAAAQLVSRLAESPRKTTYGMRSPYCGSSSGSSSMRWVAMLAPEGGETLSLLGILSMRQAASQATFTKALDALQAGFYGEVSCSARGKFVLSHVQRPALPRECASSSSGGTRESMRDCRVRRLEGGEEKADSTFSGDARGPGNPRGTTSGLNAVSRHV